MLFTGEDGRTGEGDVPVTVMAFAQQSATLLMRSRRAGRRVTLSSRRCAGRERGGPGALRRHLHRLPRGDGAGRAQQEAALQPRIPPALPAARARAGAPPRAGPAMGSPRGLQVGPQPPPPSVLPLPHCLRRARQRPALRGACRRCAAPPPGYSIAFMFDTASCPACRVMQDA